MSASKQIADVGLVLDVSSPNNLPIDTQEDAMSELEFDELAGRIDAVAQAVLRLTARLEMVGIIDGPQISQAWRQAAQPGRTPVHTASHRILQELADLLDDARRSRHLSPAH